MTEQSDAHRGTRILVIVAALMIIIVCIHQAQSVLASILVAVFLAAIGTPSVFWLEQKRIPYAAAVLLVVTGMAATLVIIGVLVGTSLNSFYTDLPYYQTRFQKDVSSLQTYMASKGIPFYDINRYMVIKTAMSLTVGFLIWLWLMLLGVDFPILWGFLAFLLHYVPNVGALIASIPAVLLALLQLGIGRAALAASGYLAVNLMLGNVVEPLLMGRRLGLSTLVVFLSLIFWGGMLGFIGVVLCIPLTMTLKFVCENNKSARWVAVLLGPEMSPAQFSSTQKEGTDRAV